MPSPLVVSIGMPRAGSGWHYNLIHDLVVASGGKDARWIRQRYLLKFILTEVNCNIGAFTAKRLLPVLIPAFFGNKFVIKAHADPSPLAIRLIRYGVMIPTYIYRDPRDAILSALEYGKRKRDAGRSGAFSDLETFNQAVEFMKKYVSISESWLACDQALHTRYEDLILNYRKEAARLADFLRIDINNAKFAVIVGKYQPRKGQRDQRGTHFEKGIIGRYQGVFSQKQQNHCLDVFGTYLEKMGYPIE